MYIKKSTSVIGYSINKVTYAGGNTWQSIVATSADISYRLKNLRWSFSVGPYIDADVDPSVMTGQQIWWMMYLETDPTAAVKYPNTFDGAPLMQPMASIIAADVIQVDRGTKAVQNNPYANYDFRTPTAINGSVALVAGTGGPIDLLVSGGLDTGEAWSLNEFGGNSCIHREGSTKKSFMINTGDRILWTAIYANSSPTKHTGQNMSGIFLYDITRS